MSNNFVQKIIPNLSSLILGKASKFYGVRIVIKNVPLMMLGISVELESWKFMTSVYTFQFIEFNFSISISIFKQHV